MTTKENALSQVTRRKLLIRPDPKPDENLAGYLLRLTEANAYDSPSVILKLSGLIDSANWRSRIPSLATAQVDITPLARFIDKKPETVGGLIYHPNSSSLEDVLLRVGRALVPADLMALQNPSICPSCLIEGLYHRQVWDIAPYTACNKHGIKLIDSCTACGQRLSWVRSKVSSCRCGSDFKGARPLIIDEQELVISRMVTECVETGEIAGHPLIKDMVSLHIVLQIGYMLTKKRPWSHTDIGFEYRTIHKRHEEVGRAFAPFAQWPESFHAFLGRLIRLERSRFPSFGTAALMYRLSMALDRFSNTVIPSAINHAVKHELDIFLASDEARLLAPDSKPTKPRGSGLIARKAAIELLDVSAQDFSRLADHRLPPSQEDGRYVYKHVVVLKMILDRLVTVREAGKILGISSYSLRLLVETGIVEAFRGPAIDGYRDILIDASVLDRMLAKLGARVPLSHSMRPEGISVVEYFKKYWITSTRRFPEVLQAALDGVLDVVAFDKESGLAGVYFDRASLSRLIGVEVPDRGALLTVDDLVDELGLYKDVIYRLMRVGLMSFRKRRINSRRPQRYVTREELARFRSQFVLPREIAVLHECNVTNLAERLMDAGVSPVSGPGIDGGLVYAFVRSHVERLDMDAVMRSTIYRTRCGRPKNGEQGIRAEAERVYLDAQDVANMLGDGISVQKVSRLVKAGLLRPVEHSGKLGNKRYFTRDVVLSYLLTYRDNPDLMRLDDVPRWLGNSRRRLEIDWIKPGRLALVEDGLGGRFAKRGDLEFIKGFRINAVSTSELADLVGKTRHDVGNAIRLGKLSAVSGPGIDEFSNYMFDRETGVQTFR